MSRTLREEAVADLLQRLATHARTEPVQRPEPLVVVSQHRRRPIWTIGLAAAFLVAALASASLVLRQDRDRPVSTTGEPAALPGGTTERLAATALTGRSGAASVWTGKELLVWGGSSRGLGPETFLADGAALDPVANRWRPLPDAPIAARRDAAVVWTGTEMVIWSGNAGDRLFVDGAAFDPRTNRWRTIAEPSFGGGALYPSVVWTGSEMLVFTSMNVPGGAAAYDPASNRWRELALPPGRLLTPFPRVAWTGTEAIILLWSGGPGRGPNSDMFLASYSPVSDRWSRLPDVDLQDGFLPPLVWTGPRCSSSRAGGPATPSTWRARPGARSPSGRTTRRRLPRLPSGPAGRCSYGRGGRWAGPTTPPPMPGRPSTAGACDRAARRWSRGQTASSSVGAATPTTGSATGHPRPEETACV